MKNVLIIEDDGWLADSYAHCLSQRGFEVRTVASAETAMDQIDEAMPDIVVADIILGRQNALTLLHELQSYADTAALPVIVCTGLSLSAREKRNLSRYGVVEVFDKAVLRPEVLADAVDVHTRE
ncbi:MAG TPA: response regulator [Candidatus Saccharimonadales bacterium]|nr:response regulator [Candidatus Saccharimonadales bacterium]